MGKQLHFPNTRRYTVWLEKTVAKHVPTEDSELSVYIIITEV